MEKSIKHEIEEELLKSEIKNEMIEEAKYTPKKKKIK